MWPRLPDESKRSDRNMDVVLLSRADQHSCYVAEPMVELNMMEANQKFMENSEELYDTLMESHWQTAEFCAEQDYLTSSLPEPIYC